jgi:hypothetical protein
LILGEVEDLLGQESQDGHVVFANGEAGMARRNDLVDEGRPVMWPFLLQDGNEDQVELVQESTFGPKAFLGLGAFDDEVDNEIPNP